MIKSPSLGYYLLQALKNGAWVTVFLRIVDAVTDITLTKTYFEDSDSVVNDFLRNILSFQSGNSSCPDIECVKKQCLENDEWNTNLFAPFHSCNGGFPGHYLLLSWQSRTSQRSYHQQFQKNLITIQHCTAGFAVKSTIGEQSFSMPCFYHWASKWQL